MKQNTLIIFLVLGLSVLSVSCEETELSNLGETLEKLEAGELSEQEVSEVVASDEQIEDMKEVITEVMGPEVKEPIEEVMTPDKRNSVDGLEIYLCKKEPPVTEIIKKEYDSCYLRDRHGGYVRDSNGGKVRVGSCGTYEVEVIVENQVNVPKYMICHAPKGMQNRGMSLCLPKAEIQGYINKARADGGTSYMGPCK